MEKSEKPEKAMWFEKAVICGYLGLVLAWAGLFTFNAVKNSLEDREAMGCADGRGGDIFDHPVEYVAFDRTGDGEIDEIKVYRRGLTGCRMVIPIGYTLRYNKGAPGFEQVKDEYLTLRKLEEIKGTLEKAVEDYDTKHR